MIRKCFAVPVVVAQTAGGAALVAQPMAVAAEDQNRYLDHRSPHTLMHQSFQHRDPSHQYLQLRGSLLILLAVPVLVLLRLLLLLLVCAVAAALCLTATSVAAAAAADV